LQGHEGLADQYGGRGIRSEGRWVLPSAFAGTDKKIELELGRPVQGINKLSDPGRR
jgi:hypothetical protein